MRGPDASLLNDLYVPALSRAIRYDRCCAYFTSRVLSVAARGFGGLIQNLLAAGHALPKPAARLLVNEQLDPDDLEALLATGDQSALIEKLLKQFKTPRDALEKSRLQMLAWLVASGWLEVRVALMRHTRGIAHAKFGLFTDPAGDAIAFSGSDNETGEALSENYEELTLGTSWQDPDFVAYYGSRFDTLWQDRDEAVTSVALPDAVRLKLVQTAPKTPPSEPVADSLSLQAAMLWHFLAAAPYMPNGEHVCDATAFVELWPHQRRVVEDTSRAFPAGRLLCDEVGMGKTIEAILVLRRLLAGRGVARALLLVPAGLLKQWQDELREKGGLLVPRWESGLLLQPDGAKPSKMEAVEAFSTQPLLLVSREWVRLEGNRQLILAAPAWDLVLLDEAHAARRKESVVTEFNSGNLLLQLIRELQLRRRTRGIILLSATPMQTQPWEPWDLLTVLGVGGDWAVEFADIDTFYRGVARAEQGRLDHATAQSVARLAGADPAFPPLPGVAGNGNLAQVLTFALPDEQRTYAGWLRKGAPLTRRMHRNTKDTLRSYYQRGLLPLPPPQRNVDDVVFDYHDHAERQVYDAIETYINQRYEQLETEKPGKGFVMTVYRRRAASSPQALRESLHRRLDGLERVLKKQHAADWFTAEEIGVDPRDLGDADLDEKIDAALPRTPQAAAAEKSELVSLLNALESLGNTDTKFERFWEVLHAITADGRAVLVFTEYTDTLEYLRELLRPTYGTTLACYSGDGGLTWSGQGWRAVAKPEITARLAAGEIKVLLCTDAASEGLNLQSAGALINYDLPWNPSKVEQRIGRIDRIGQAQPTVPVRNLFLSASVDMLVYNALRQRCGLFERFVGQMQPIIAVARDALRRNLRREAVGPLIQQIAALADQLGSNPAAASAYVSSDTDGAAPPPSFITRSDLASALDMLARLQSGPVRASRTRYAARWTIRGIGRRSVDVTTSREELERDATVIPATLSGSLAPAIAGKLPMPASRVPLVTAEHSIGAFRCVEARWVSPNDSQPVNSLSQLRGLIAGWDGAGPPLSAVVKAQAEARETARQRAEAAASAARKAEEDGIEQQLLAARKRLLRELGRTLRCHGPGDLGAAFRARLQQESRADGRYHQALSLLGTYPAWDADETNQIDAFAASLGTHARQARLAGSEIDAALHDPRWLAADS